MLTLTLIGVDVLAVALSPIIFKIILESHMRISTSAMLWLSIAFMTTWIVKKLIRYVREILFFGITNQAVRDIRMQLILHIHKIPLDLYNKHNAPEIISANARVSMSIRNFMNVTSISIFPNILKLITLSLSLIYAFNLSIVLIGGILTSYWFVYTGLRKFSNSRQSSWDATDKTFTAMDDSIENSKVARFYKSYETNRIKKYFEIEAYHWFMNNMHQHLLHLTQGGIFFFTAGIILIPLILSWHSGEFSLSQMVLIKGFIVSIYAPMMLISLDFRKLVSGYIDMKKVLQILSLPTDDRSDKILRSNQSIIEFKSVTFQYSDLDRLICKDLSFSINKGQKIAIVGPSGEGKSTICQLMSGLILPSSGSILFKGINTKDLSLDAIGKHLRYVSQDASPFASSTTTNNLDGDLPIKLNILPREAKINVLSGGEKQRILLEKALQNSPEIVILDETLHALDEESAISILKNIFKVTETVVLVTHRSSLLHLFDKVYKIENNDLHLQAS